MGELANRFRPTQSKCSARGGHLLISTATVLVLSLGIIAATTEKAAAQAVCTLSANPGGAGTVFGGNANSLACGPQSQAWAPGTTAVGDEAHATTDNSTALGYQAFAEGSTGGEGNTALGALSQARNSDTTAVGYKAIADSGDRSTALGYQSVARGVDNTALGSNALVGEAGAVNHSTAIGADAVATQNNQFVMGTQSDTYKAPGITSSLSKSRQSGPLQVVTSDAGGNLATDGGEIFRTLDQNQNSIDKNRQGVALALAAVNPDLTRDERFGITANWGGFDGANAFGMGFEGVVGHDFITRGDRVAITGGWGVGFADGSGDDVYGGRVGAQWTWGGHP